MSAPTLTLTKRNSLGSGVGLTRYDLRLDERGRILVTSYLLPAERTPEDLAPHLCVRDAVMSPTVLRERLTRGFVVAAGDADAFLAAAGAPNTIEASGPHAAGREGPAADQAPDGAPQAPGVAAGEGHARGAAAADAVPPRLDAATLRWVARRLRIEITDAQDPDDLRDEAALYESLATEAESRQPTLADWIAAAEGSASPGHAITLIEALTVERIDEWCGPRGARMRATVVHGEEPSDAAASIRVDVESDPGIYETCATPAELRGALDRIATEARP